MKRGRVRMALAGLAALGCLVLGVMWGTVSLSPGEILAVLGHKLFGLALPAGVPETAVSILWNLRLPRALLAFLVGGALSVCGAVMQSVLKNPLASPLTLGVSSGASLGAALVILFGLNLPLLGSYTLPFAGLVFALGTVFLALSFSSRIDKSMSTHTVVLVGMVFSLFANAVVTLLMGLSRQEMQRLILWQMGSFSSGGWISVRLLLPVLVAALAVFVAFSRELDVLSFGEEQAGAIGVDVRRYKWLLLSVAAALTGTAISLVGVIGFVDLIVPHMARRLFGSVHRRVIPASALIGGGFMVLCDLAARTVVAPRELPVGSVCALIGAPFFAYIYFSGRPRRS